MVKSLEFLCSYHKEYTCGMMDKFSHSIIYTPDVCNHCQMEIKMCKE